MKRIILSLFIVILFLGCEKDDFVDIEAIQNTTEKLVGFYNSGNLLKSVSAEENQTVLNFELESILLSHDCFDYIEEDKTNWKSTIYFKDNSSVVVGMIGDSLNISENIELNPSGYNPLAAQLTFSTPVKGNIKVIIHGKKENDPSIERTYNFWDNSHSISITGLFPGHTNHVKIILLDRENKERASKTIKLDVPPLAENLDLATVELIHSTPEKMESGLTLISYPGVSDLAPSIPFMIDCNGEIRWLLDMREHPELKNMKYGNGIEPLHNGNLYFAERNTNAIYEVDLLGNVISQWVIPAPYSFHHDVQEKANGNFLISVTKEGSLHLNGKETNKDFIIEIERSSGNVITEWDLRQSLDETRRELTAPGRDKTGVNWAHVNAVFPSEEDNTILVSCRYQGIAKLTYDNNVKWIIAPHKGWTVNRRQETMANFLLQPLDATNSAIRDENVVLGDASHNDFEWCWGPHAPLIMPNGNIAMFDNGYSRNFTEEELYSRSVEYNIDEKNKTIKQVWQYGKNRGAETFSKAVSDVDYLPEKNNILFCPGKGVQNPGGMGGRVIEIDYETKEVVFEVAINAGSSYAFHRAERVSLSADNFTE